MKHRYSEIKDGALFFCWHRLLCRKVGADTAIVFGCSVEHWMDADEMVESVELEDLVSFALAGERIDS